MNLYVASSSMVFITPLSSGSPPIVTITPPQSLACTDPTGQSSNIII